MTCQMADKFEIVMLMARTLWFLHVDAGGYPSGLPTWNEILAEKNDGQFGKWYREFVGTALDLFDALEANGLTIKAIAPAKGNEGNEG